MDDPFTGEEPIETSLSVSKQRNDIPFTFDADNCYDEVTTVPKRIQEDVPITDVEFDIHREYDELNDSPVSVEAKFGFSHGPIKPSMLVPKRKKKKPSRESKTNNSSQKRKKCAGDDCEHSRALMSLQRRVQERYVLVPRKLMVYLSDDTTKQILWYSPIHMDFLMDMLKHWLYAVFLASGWFKLKSVHVVLGKHVVNFNGKFTPGYGQNGGVCSSGRSVTSLFFHLIVFQKQLSHVSSTVPAYSMNQPKSITVGAPINPNTKVLQHYTTSGFDADNMMLGRGYCKFTCHKSATYDLKSSARTAVCCVSICGQTGWDSACS